MEHGNKDRNRVSYLIKNTQVSAHVIRYFPTGEPWPHVQCGTLVRSPKSARRVFWMCEFTNRR